MPAASSKITFLPKLVFVTSVAFSLAIPSAVLSQTVSSVPRMEQVIQSYVASNQFMGAVLVNRGNDLILDKGYGFANIEWEIPNSPSTKFRLGSITKQFTAASILLLEERGKLSVDDTVKKYLPDAPTAWDKITIFNLLTHTSGIPDYTRFPDYASLEPFPTTPEKLVARFRDKPLDFQPGEKYGYSSSGYAVLGYLIEKISGESYEKFLQENIFTPLGMKDSGYDSNSAVIPHRAAGYTRGPNGPVNAKFVDMTVPLSAGGLYSTVEDLLRWELGLFGGKLLSTASLQKMTTPFKNGYAFGLVVQTANGHKVIEHNGGINGFNTMLAYFPEDRLTVAVLSNINGPVPSELAQKLAGLAHGEKVVLPSERKKVAVDPAILGAYSGIYEIPVVGQQTVTVKDNKLYLQSAALGPVPVELLPESDTDFFLSSRDITFTFQMDEQGVASKFITHVGTQDCEAKRLVLSQQ